MSPSDKETDAGFAQLPNGGRGRGGSPAVRCHQSKPPGLSWGDNRPGRRGDTNGLVKGLSRLLSTLAVLVVALGGAAIWPGGSPASADAKEAVKLTAPQTVVKAYDPLVGPDEVNFHPFTKDPDNCSTRPYCDTIPIELTVSDSVKNSDTEDYFLRLKVEWDNSGGNNVNLYLYDSPYKGDFWIAKSATGNMPETINLYRPEKKAYLLVVHNTSGVNAGYKLTAAITVEAFGGAPDFGGVNENPNRPTTTRPPADNNDDDFGFDDGSDGDFTAPPPLVDNGFGPPALAGVDQDSSLSALARQRGGLADSLAAPRITRVEEEKPPPAPVSGVTVALLGGVLPASVVGSGIWLLRRKGGAASTGL